MSILEFIFDWIIDPLMDMLMRRGISGKWHLSYLFPIATALGGILWWLGARFDSIVLLVFGVLTAVLFGLFSIVTFIPREVEEWEELKRYTTRKSSKVEKPKDKNEEA